MDLQSLKVSQCYESETNPRGTDFEDKAFQELVASIKEKGVLVPVLARKVVDGYEVVAGNRRLRAAKIAGLKEIPAHVKEMSDEEALEAQIVENLQRADVHPLEEGEAYRKLIEDGGKTVKDVAVKVGKSETYVRQRLFLTNLSEKARKAYRAGEMSDAVSVLVARLTASNQDKMLKEARWSLDSVSEAKTYIERTFSNPLKNQPWLASDEASAAVGPCKECPPSRAALFGNVKDGACTDLRCWSRKMATYIKWQLNRNPNLVLVSTNYGKPDQANLVSRSDYEPVKKTGCDFATQAIIAEGNGVGSMLWVCASAKCEEHHPEHRDYRASPDEKERRKKEREREEEKRAKFDEAVCDALMKVTWPLHSEKMDALLDIMLDRMSTSYLMPICKRHGLKADKTKDGSRDYRAPLRKLAEGGGKDGKLRMIFELQLPTYNTYGDDKQMKKLITKL